MNLSAPTQLVFIIAVIIALVAVLTALGFITFLPMPSVWVMAIAFAVLAAGNLFKGI